MTEVGEYLKTLLSEAIEKYVDQGPGREEYETYMISLMTDMVLKFTPERMRENISDVLSEKANAARMLSEKMRPNWGKFLELEPKMKEEISKLIENKEYFKLFVDYLQICSSVEDFDSNPSDGLEPILLHVFKKEALIRFLRERGGIETLCDQLYNFCLENEGRGF